MINNCIRGNERFKVKVKRLNYTDKSLTKRVYTGTFVSEVYYVDYQNREFLVYDPGGHGVRPGFMFVDFDESIGPLNQDEEAFCKEMGIKRLPTVELLKGVD